ncbi:MAG: hypothetical protein AAGI66_08275 [Cyanobacteria bacterium P01_H01_bin.74]
MSRFTGLQGLRQAEIHLIVITLETDTIGVVCVEVNKKVHKKANFKANTNNKSVLLRKQALGS